jgi:choline dehydrogenase-like flavoprotein
MNTELVTPPTRAALEARLRATERIAAGARPTPRFFTNEEFFNLTAVCSRLLAPGPGDPISGAEIAGAIDARIADGKTDGWRFDGLPRDGEAYRAALNWLDSATASPGGDGEYSAICAFAAAATAAQDVALSSLRDGRASIPGLDRSERIFQDLLAEAVEIYYSHPLAQEEIGYTGAADGRGWKRIGLGEADAWEPRPNAPYVLPSDATPVPPQPGAGAREAGEIILLPGVPPPPPEARSAATTVATTRARAVPGAPVHTSPVDVVIIGTGAGGAPLLARFAQAGLSVVALEAGRFWEPVRDFATDERAQEKLFWTDERLSTGADPIPFGGNNSGTGVGGSTLHYTAFVPRSHPDDFRVHTDFGVGADWPFGYEQLEPYLTEVEQFLGVSGPIPYPWSHGSGLAGYPLPPLPLNGPALLMERGCRKLGLRTSAAPNAALSAPYRVEGVGLRRPCTNRGFCQAGCSVGAKASMDVTYVPLALAAGAEVRSECFVTRFERDRATGGVTGVVYTQADGREVRQSCRAVFLCGGAIETPRLLLLNGIGNGSGQVGRNFMAHPAVQLWGQFDEEVRPWKGIPGGLISEDTHRPALSEAARALAGEPDFAGGYLLQSIGVMPVTYVSQLARGAQTFGPDLRRHMLGFNHVAGINVLGEGLPSPVNFLELSEEKDDRGLAKPRIHYTAGDQERRLNAHAERLLRAIWQAAGARDHVWTYGRYAHTLGTCRMGSDPSTSVVDQNGRVWDVPNLYVCDTSIFPSSLAVNPALTQMAVSLRIADRFLAAVRRGEA